MILAVHRREPTWNDPSRTVHVVTISGTSYWVETDGPAPTEQQVSAHLNPPPPPVRIPLAVIQSRLEAESGWDTYVNHMFGTAARRNAFLKTMFIGKPVQINGNGFVTSLQGAGFNAEQIGRITAPV